MTVTTLVLSDLDAQYGILAASLEKVFRTFRRIHFSVRMPGPLARQYV